MAKIEVTRQFPSMTYIYIYISKINFRIKIESDILPESATRFYSPGKNLQT